LDCGDDDEVQRALCPGVGGEEQVSVPPPFPVCVPPELTAAEASSGDRNVGRIEPGELPKNEKKM
jgi:hypothetical protein